jgi:hypothetical protein
MANGEKPENTGIAAWRKRSESINKSAANDNQRNGHLRNGYRR